MTSNAMNETLIGPDELAAHVAATARVRGALEATLLGQERAIELVLIAVLARGHVLLEGLPGLGKTELIKSLARLLELDFRRIQFTPDLLPGDITGSHVLEEREGVRTFVFRRGPIFGHLVLADEINRASPKTQSALLEAMQEGRVTLLGATHELPRPFFVLATQNPIELEGTYPLPEAQLDRFLFKIEMPPVGAEVLAEIAGTRPHGRAPALEPVLDAAGLERLFAATDRIHLPRPVAGFIGRLVAASHPGAADDELARLLRWGASPRAAIALAAAGRAAALLAGRPAVAFEDVRRVARAVLAHRIVPSYEAGIEGVGAADLVDRLLTRVPDIASAPKEVRQA